MMLACCRTMTFGFVELSNSLLVDNTDDDDDGPEELFLLAVVEVAVVDDDVDDVDDDEVTAGDGTFSSSPIFTTVSPFGIFP